MIRIEKPEDLQAIIERLRLAQRDLARLPLPKLLEPLDRLAGIWQPGGEPYRRALEMLAGVFSQQAIERALQGLTLGISSQVLMAELQRELGRADLLDAWLPDELNVGHVRGFPLGVVAQVLAGNVFLGGVVAIAQGLLTRNAVLLKLSREESGFTSLFAETLKQADGGGLLSGALAVCSWSSEQEALNEVVRREADGVVVWGGAAAIAAYPADRCKGRVIHYGPRLGVGLVLDGVNLDASLPALAWDVALWEQRACSSPRVLLVEDAEGSGSLPKRVAIELSRALNAIEPTFPVRPLTLDEKAEVLSLRETTWWQQQGEVIAATGSMGHTIVIARSIPESIPLGFRTVLVVPVRRLDDIPAMLTPMREYLQTATLAASPDRWARAVESLVRAGFTQISAAGAASARVLGLPHEGEFALRRLVKLVGVDLGIGPLACPGRDVAGILPNLASVEA